VFTMKTTPRLHRTTTDLWSIVINVNDHLRNGPEISGQAYSLESSALIIILETDPRAQAREPGGRVGPQATSRKKN